MENTDTPMCTIFFSRDLQIRYFTPEAQRIFDFVSINEAVSLTDLPHTLNYDSLAQDAANVLMTLQPLEREVQAANGNTYTLRLSPFYAMDNEIAGVVLNILDITERKKAEEAKFFLASIVESSQDSILTINFDRHITSWNKAAERLYGYPAAEVLGKPLTMLTLPEDLQEVLNNVDKVKHHKTVEIFDTIRVNKDGRQMYLEVVLSPVKNATGQVIGVSTIARERTEHRLAQERLRLSEERLSRTLAISTVGIMYFNAKGYLTDCNDAFLTLCGFTRKDISSGTINWKDLTPPEWLERSQQAFEELEKEGRTTPYEKEFFRKDGSRFWALFASSKINANEKVKYVIDVSERKKVENALRESEEKYRNLFNEMDEGYAIVEVIFDADDQPIDYRMLEVNPRFEQLTGLSIETALSGKTIREIAPELEEKWYQLYGQVARTGEPLRFEEYAQAWDRWYDVYAFRIQEPEQRRVAIFYNDISERKRREANLTFLADLQNDFVRLTAADEIMKTVGEKIGIYLQVAQCLFAQINEAQDQVLIEHVWHNEESLDLTGVYQLSNFVTKEFQQIARAKETIVIRNTQTDARTDADSYAAFNIYAFVTVPFHQGEEWKYLLTLNNAQPRDWRKDEVELIREFSNQLFQRLERARAEVALRRSEQQLRLITDAIPALVSYVDADYRYRFVNKMYKQWFGYQPEDILGKHVREMLGEKVYEVILPNLKKVLAGEELNFETLLVYKNAGARHVHVNYIPDIQPNGVKGYYSLVQDITERALAEEALRNSEERYRTLFNSIDEGFCVCEMLFDEAGNPSDYRFLEVNPMYAKLTGFNQVVGKTARELEPELEEKWFEIYSNVVLTGEAVRFESHLETWDKWYDRYVTRIGKPEERKFAILFSDITERKQTEAALRDADRRKNEFLATLAHELRNPLTPIRSALEILNHSEDREQQQQVRTIIERQIRKIVILVDDLLEISRITRGKIQLHKEIISLQKVIRDVVETTEPIMVAAGHQFTLQIPEELICIDADDIRIAQVIINIVNNAIKYTNTGGTISLIVTTENDQVVIRVKDNGIGIPTDRLESIFEIFEQVEHQGKKFQSGLGIGLSLAKELTQLHGGTITAYSEGEGKGSEFIVRLPLAEDQTPLDNEPPCEDDPAIPAFEGNRKRILVVEDDLDIGDMLQAVLELENYTVQIANTGEYAIQLANEFQPEAALVDIGLPDIEGYEVARRLRVAHPDLLLIAHSGWGAEEDRQRSREAGFDYHLVKPAEMEEIIALLTK